MSTQWFYDKHGERQGGYTLEEMQALIQEGQIDHLTLVWTQGMATWVLLEQTPLGESLPPPLPTSPPISSKARTIETSKVFNDEVIDKIKVTHWSVILLAISPFIGIIVVSLIAVLIKGEVSEYQLLRHIARNFIFYLPVWLLIIVGFWHLDKLQLKRQGINYKKFKGHWFIGTYFYYRLNKNVIYTAITCVIFVFSAISFSTLSEKPNYEDYYPRHTSAYDDVTETKESVPVYQSQPQVVDMQSMKGAKRFEMYLNNRKDLDMLRMDGRATVSFIGDATYKVEFANYCGSGGCTYEYYAVTEDNNVCKLDAQTDEQARAAIQCSGMPFSIQ